VVGAGGRRVLARQPGGLWSVSLHAGLSRHARVMGLALPITLGNQVPSHVPTTGIDMTDGIRWLQRFANYTKALQSLSDAVSLAGERPLSKLEQQGLIQAFEFTHELAWNVLKDYLEQQGILV